MSAPTIERTQPLDPHNAVEATIPHGYEAAPSPVPAGPSDAEALFTVARALQGHEDTLRTEYGDEPVAATAMAVKRRLGTLLMRPMAVGVDDLGLPVRRPVDADASYTQRIDVTFLDFDRAPDDFVRAALENRKETLAEHRRIHAGTIADRQRADRLGLTMARDRNPTAKAPVVEVLLPPAVAGVAAAAIKHALAASDIPEADARSYRESMQWVAAHTASEPAQAVPAYRGRHRLED